MPRWPKNCTTAPVGSKRLVKTHVHTLSIRCGSRALATLKSDGLQPGAVDIIPAAAGGPKGLALQGLDKVLFGEWLPRQPRIRFLIGSSIGSWRMAALALADPIAGIERLADLYCGQRYAPKPSRAVVSRYCEQLVHDLIADRSAEILQNPHYRLNILAVRGKKLLASDGPRRTPAGFAAAALSNFVSRRHLRHWLDRTWFHDPRDLPPILPLHDFHTHEVALSPDNLHSALLASGSIPMILDAVKHIAGAPSGNYWDGGIIDYHLHLPYDRSPGLVLYPHFTDHIVPGWLDKSLPWRRARDTWLDNVILISPSREFIASLPGKKLPDRRDFKRYGPSEQEERIRVWRHAIGESQRLGEEFLRLVDSGEFAQRAKAL